MIKKNNNIYIKGPKEYNKANKIPDNNIYKRPKEIYIYSRIDIRNFSRYTFYVGDRNRFYLIDEG